MNRAEIHRYYRRRHRRKERTRAFRHIWKEWGITAEEALDLVGAVSVVVILPVTMAIAGVWI